MSAQAGFLIARIVEDETRAEYVHVLHCELNAGEWMTTGECDCGQPDRVLAECEAKRQIIALDDRGYDMEPAMMHLATVYAGHPDYRGEWKP